ncbi:AmmeMemoRadiSam system protein A [Sulfurimonas sp.]|uniref:AmmeMemoRadiSam system protein A n=1 Tax=Sulfurimonas sp. TaxID=2022749 RepID=UPI003D134F44
MLDPILLRIAKSAILAKLDAGYSFDASELGTLYPFLNEQGACFVTLHFNKDLRGCIGSIIAHKTLLEDILDNAASAAFRDPRFSPVRVGELDSINLEVSVLTTPEPIEYSDYDDLKLKIVPKKDGLILKAGGYQGTFLPQVWDQLPTTEQFLEHLAYKAGTNPSIYQQHPIIYRYRVEVIEEDFDAILPL